MKEREIQRVRETHSEVLAIEERKLVEEIYPSLRRFASAVRPAGEDGNDLVQEALFRALRKNGSLTRLANPAAYLKRSIVNLAKDRNRSEHRRRMAWSKLEPTAPEVPQYSWALDELRSVSPKSRAVLYLRIIEGWSYAEIGEMLGSSEVSARVAAARGRRKLQALLGKEVRDATA